MELRGSYKEMSLRYELSCCAVFDCKVLVIYLPSLSMSRLYAIPADG